MIAVARGRHVVRQDAEVCEECARVTRERRDMHHTMVRRMTERARIALEVASMSDEELKAKWDRYHTRRSNATKGGLTSAMRIKRQFAQERAEARKAGKVG